MTDEFAVGVLSSLVALKWHSIEVGPGEVVAELFATDFLLCHFLSDVRVVLCNRQVEIVRDFRQSAANFVSETSAILLGKGQGEVLLETCLLNREGLKTMGQRMSAKLLLPLGEVGTFDGRNSIALLPFSQVVGLGRGVKTHHLGLEREDVLGNEGRLEVHLADDILLVQRFGLVNISTPQLRADKELLALADRCDSVGILRLLLGVDGEVETSLRAGQGRSVQSNDKLDIFALARVLINGSFLGRSNCNKGCNES